MSYFKVQLTRSAIGLPKKVSGALHALGLTKRMRIVYHPVSRDIAGMIMRVKELVDVEQVDKALSKEEIKASRTPAVGFHVEQRAEDLATKIPVPPKNQSVNWRRLAAQQNGFKMSIG